MYNVSREVYSRVAGPGFGAEGAGLTIEFAKVGMTRCKV